MWNNNVWPAAAVYDQHAMLDLMTQLQHLFPELRRGGDRDVQSTDDVSLWLWPLTLEVTAIVGHMRLGALWE